jgi:opacity protein-like surface antigen
MPSTTGHAAAPTARPVWLGVLLAICLATPTHAAGGPDPDPASAWEGPYVGVNIGSNFGSTGVTQTSLRVGTDLSVSPDSPLNSSLSPEGLTGGLGIGYDWQIGPFVFGSAADADFGHIDASGTTSGVTQHSGGAVFESTRQTDLEWLATLRGRAGYLVTPDALVYATGGLAIGGTSSSASLNSGASPGFPGGSFSGSRSVVQPGWALGAGAQYAVISGWLLGAEYLHYHLEGTTVDGYPAMLSAYHTQTDLGLRGDMLRVSVTHRFGTTSAAPPGNAPRFDQDLPNWLTGMSYELGTRYFFSLGSMKYHLYQGDSSHVNSILTYSGLQAHAAEVFGRIDHPVGLFVTGFAGVGAMNEGQLKDEDFPPAVTPYSSTQSSQHGGSVSYATLDIGYKLLRTGQFSLGPFVGYSYFNSQMNAYGCLQTATSSVCSNVSSSALDITEDATWNALRLGLAADAQLWRGIRLTASAAWLPVGGLAGTDTHWLRLNYPGSQGLVTPIAQSGVIQGVQAELRLSYPLTHWMTLGTGARFWEVSTRGTSTFSSSVGTSVPATLFHTQWYGAFLDASVAF